jgi:hypothetical protein
MTLEKQDTQPHIRTLEGTQPNLLTLAEIRAAVGLLEQECAAGRMSDAETARRVNDCRRAVTPRDLWKATGRRAGSRRRSDWADIGRTAFRLLCLMIMIALGVWLVTFSVALYAAGS